MKTSSKKSRTKTSSKKTVTEKQFKKVILDLFYSAEEVKNASKVCSIQLLHSPNVSDYTKLISSCLELKETVDLCQFYIANKSPFVKNVIKFTQLVLNGNIGMLTEIKNKVKPTGAELAVIKHVISVNSKLLANLDKLYKIA